jgi:NAD(P)-dependent dehydrogenase (short-subunit alcohol dehydrogenase family)
MKLSGRTALVTGTARGIGPAIARALRAEGAHVLCHARTEDGAREAAVAVEGEPIWGDLAYETEIAAIAAQTRALAPRLDVLVHNAGILRRGGVEDVTADDLLEVYRVNVVAPILLTQALLPELRHARARIVVLSSTMGQFAGGMGGGSLPYRASKAAINVFVVNAAVELATVGIKINAMHPGWVRTAMGGPAASVTPEKAAETALFLASLPDDGPSGGFFRDGREIPW